MINRLDSIRRELEDSWVGPAGFYSSAPSLDEATEDVTHELITMESRTPKRVHVTHNGRIIKGTKGYAKLANDEENGVLAYECHGRHVKLITVLNYDMEDVMDLGAWQIAETVARSINGGK